MTYEDALSLIDSLINELEKNKTIEINTLSKYSIIYDALASYEIEVSNELERQKLIRKYENFK